MGSLSPTTTVTSMRMLAAPWRGAGTQTGRDATATGAPRNADCGAERRAQTLEVGAHVARGATDAKGTNAFIVPVQTEYTSFDEANGNC